jgi:hypothetical protein
MDAEEVTVPGVEAKRKTCRQKSKRFKNPCYTNSKCAQVCHGEGWSGGNCDGALHECTCIKNC